MLISTFPKAFVHSITVEIVADDEDHCIISLANEQGRVRMMMGVNLKEGLNNIVVDQVDSLEMGGYQLQVKNIDAKILYRTELTKQ